jgi:hypothetical protein
METQSPVRISSAVRSAYLHYRDLLYFTPPGVVDPGEYGITPADLQNVAVGNAIGSMLSAVGYVGPDQEGAPSVHGPAGPYIRDVLIGLTVAHLASSLTDRELGSRLQASALDGVSKQVQQMQRNLG